MRRASTGVLSLPRDVIVSQNDRVLAYLAKHDDLADTLSSICERARREFGATAELNLTFEKDADTRARTLQLVIRLPEYDATTIHRIEQLTAAFDEALTAASGWLLVTTDFRPPQHTAHAV